MTETNLKNWCDTDVGLFCCGENTADCCEATAGGKAVFSLIVIVVVFIIVITNLWTVLMASMKIPMYRQAGKGWWWQGEWGQKRWKKYRKSKRRYREPAEENGYSSPNY